MGAIAALEAAGKKPGKDVMVVSIDGEKDARAGHHRRQARRDLRVQPALRAQGLRDDAALRQRREDPAVGHQHRPLLRREQRQGADRGQPTDPSIGAPWPAAETRRLPPPEDPDASHRPARSQHAGVDKSFGGVPALSGASLEVAPGRGPCPDRPERRRQVDADQGPDRATTSRTPGEILFEGEPVAFGSPQRRPRRPASAPSTRRSTWCRSAPSPRTSASGARRAASACSTGRPCNARGAALLARFDVGHRRAPAADGLPHRHAADGRHRPSHRLLGASRHHGRADLLARRPRGRRALRRHPPAEGGGRLGGLRQPQARRTLRRLRPRHGHARRRAPCRPGHGRGRQDRPGRHHAGARADAARARPATRPRAQGEPLLDVPASPAAGACATSRFDVRRGEIVGLAGLLGVRPHGDGADRLRRRPAGFRRGPHRRRPAPSTGPPTRSRAGLGFCTEDRKLEGIVPGLSVRENMTLAIMPRLTRSGIVDEAASSADRRHVHRAARHRCPRPEQPIRELSGGNQQKVLLARWLCMNPRLLILDEPTRGIDVGAKAEIQTLVARARRGGTGRADDLLGAGGDRRGGDRVFVLRDGVTVAELTGADADGGRGHGRHGRRAAPTAPGQPPMRDTAASPPTAGGARRGRDAGCAGPRDRMARPAGPAWCAGGARAADPLQCAP